MNTLQLETVAIADLHANPANPRYDLADTTALADSIAQIGVIQPLTVTADPDGGYVIVAGHRRHAAAQAAGLESVPCVIATTDTAHTVAAMVHENHHRQGLTDAEYARGVQGMLDAGWDIPTTAKGLGIKQATVKTLKAASGAGEDVRGLLHAGTVTLDESLALADIETADPDQYAVTLAAIGEGRNPSWEIRQARERIGRNTALGQAQALSTETGVEVLERVDRWSTNTETLTDPAEHVGLKCYGVYPTADREGNPLVEHWCVNVRAHRTTTSRGVDGGEVDEAARAERRRVIANNKAWGHANDVRAAWLTESLHPRTTIPRKHLIDVLALNVASPYDATHVRQAVAIVAGFKDGAWPSRVDTAKATGGENARLRTHLLATVLSFEDRMDKTIWRHRRKAFHTYLQLLAALGYTPTPPEAEYMRLANCGDDPAIGDYAQQ